METSSCQQHGSEHCERKGVPPHRASFLSPTALASYFECRAEAIHAREADVFTSVRFLAGTNDIVSSVGASAFPHGMSGGIISPRGKGP